VAAIAASRGLSTVAPYFDRCGARARPERIAGARADRAVVLNNHLVYALTWAALALMAAAGAVFVNIDLLRPAGSAA
jgi:surfeit locus 1 family protein